MTRSSQVSIRARLIRRFGILASCTALAAAPNFAFPHNLRQNQVTDADITSEREMCEWFNAQFDAMMDQINTFNANLAASRDDYSAPGIQKQADAVTADIDQSED
jgi:hypothetical protein